MTKWSFSGLKQMMNCPRQYHETKILKNYVSEETDQIRYGKDVHTALELYVRDNIPLPKNYRMFQKAVDALLDIPGDKHCEIKMGIKADRVTPCEFDDPDYWVHGIADLVIVGDDHAYVVDYKTGSPRYADSKQLKLMALMLFARIPTVKRVKSGLLFLSHNHFVPEEYGREQIPNLWQSFDYPLKQMEVFTNTGQWPANPTGLCRKHCPVSSCQYHGSHR